MAMTEQDVGMLEDTEIDALCTEHQALTKDRDRCEARIQEIKGVLGVELAIRGAKRLERPHAVVQIIDQERESLSKQLLVEHGVSVGTIQQCTVKTPSSYVRVDKRK